MVKLSITAINTSVTVQDPRAITQNNGEQAVISVEAGDTKAVDMQFNQLERIAEQLSALAALGFMTFAVDASDSPAFVQQADSVDNPSLDVVPAGIAFNSSTGVDVVGANLFMRQVQAVQAIAGVGAAGGIDLEILDPGYAGNDWDVQVIDSTGAGPATAALSVVDGRTILTIDLVGVTLTCTAAAALIKALTGVKATVTGVGATLIVLQALAAFTGGVGTGLALTLAGAPCVITDVDLTGTPTVEVITVTTPDLTGTAIATDTVKLRIRSEAKEDLASVVLA